MKCILPGLWGLPVNLGAQASLPARICADDLPARLPTLPESLRSQFSSLFTALAGLVLYLLSSLNASAAPKIAIEQPAGRPLVPAGRVVAWGSNRFGQTNVPRGLKNVQAIAAGEQHTVALRTDGTVVAWGLDNYGQASVPNGLTGVQAIAAGDRHTVAAKSDGTIVGWGGNDFGQITAPGAVLAVQALAAGQNHTVALKSDGTVLAWGSNLQGQTSVPIGLTEVRSIAAGGYHTIALKYDGALVAWGGNTYGATFVPGWLTDVRAIAAGWYHNVAVRSDGTVVALGLDNYGQTMVPGGLTNVKAVAGGWYHSVAVTRDGTVVGWGKMFPPAGLRGMNLVAAGEAHTVALSGSTVEFSDQTDGTTSTPKTFSITNAGDVALNILGVSVVGAEAADFSLNPVGMITNVSVNSGRTTFTVSFTPRAEGFRTATLRVLSDDPDESIFDVELTGTATSAAEIAVFDGAGTAAGSERIDNSGTLDFAKTDVGSRSPEQVFTIKNTGNRNLNGLVLKLTGTNSGDFLLGGLEAQTLAPNAITTFTVAFAPNFAGARNAVVNIINSDANENPFEIPVAGRGLAPEITIEQPAGTPLVAAGTVVAWGNFAFDPMTMPGGLTGVRSIARGPAHTLAVRNTGSVVAWGDNEYGQTKVPSGLADVQAVAAGRYFSMALRSDGTVVTWGWEAGYSLSVPLGLTGVRAIAAGQYHAVALKNDGTVVAWGGNRFGESRVPRGLTGVKDIAAGSNHTVAVTTNGTVVAWGLNDGGQSIVPNDLSGVEAITAGDLHNVALKSDGTILAWGKTAREPDGWNVPDGLTKVHAVAAGLYHTVTLKEDGSVVAWGLNYSGQTNVPAGLTGVQAIMAGWDYSVALTGSTVSFGDQTVARTGEVETFTIKNTGDAALHITRVSVTGGNASDFTVDTTGMLTSVPEYTGATTFAVTFTPHAPGRRATILRVQSDDGNKAVFDIGLTGVGIGLFNPEIAVFTGASTVAGNERTDNADTQIFSGTNIGSRSALQIYTIQNTGIPNLTGLSLRTVGTNPGDFILDALGATTLAPNAATTFAVSFGPTRAGNRSAQVKITSNEEEPFRINVRGMGLKPQILVEQPSGAPLAPATVVAWGANHHGQTNVPGGLNDVKAVAAGGEHSVALKNDGTVVVWSLNYDGQMDIPDGLIDVEAIAAGAGHIAALKRDGTVVAWGRNDFGQTNVPYGLAGVQAISAGGGSTVALKRDGTLVGWGDSRQTVPSQLTSIQAVSAGAAHTVALRNDGTVVAWGYNDTGRANVPSGLAEIQAIAAGGSHTVALRKNGTVVAWGDKYYGQTNVPAGLTGVTAIAVGVYHTIALKSDGAIVGWGGNFDGQAQAPFGLARVQAIAAGRDHTLALTGSMVDFGEQFVGSTSTVKTFTVKNSGDGTLNLAKVNVAGIDATDFLVDTGTLPAALPSTGDEFNFVVTFTPRAVGSKTATLRLLSNDPDHSSFEIVLTGGGLRVPRVVGVMTIGGAILLEFSGNPGAAYRVQYATSLGLGFNWREFDPATRLQIPSNGAATYTDPNPIDPMRFYRAVELP